MKAEEEAAKGKFKVEVYRMALPMHSKKAKEVTKTVMDMFLCLRKDGFHLNHIHANQGHQV